MLFQEALHLIWVSAYKFIKYFLSNGTVLWQVSSEHVKLHNFADSYSWLGCQSFVIRKAPHKRKVNHSQVIVRLRIRLVFKVLEDYCAKRLYQIVYGELLTPAWSQQICEVYQQVLADRYFMVPLYQKVNEQSIDGVDEFFLLFFQ